MAFLFGEVRGKGMNKTQHMALRDSQSGSESRQDVVALTHRSQCCKKNVFQEGWGQRRGKKMVVCPVSWGLGLCLVFTLRVSF